MEKQTKQILICICLIIVCLIIIRCLYFYLNIDFFGNNFFGNKEGFAVNNELSIDLLSKFKSNDAQIYASPTSNNLEMQIHSWSTKIYNMQSTSQQVKPISLYKPKLFVNGVQYCKLGDMLSQNADYSPPNENQFTVLIKQDGSDIKQPTKYELMVDLNLPNFNINYYTYDQYISNPISLNTILSNLKSLNQTYNNLNILIQNNLSNINDVLKTSVLNSSQVKINGANYSLAKLLENKQQQEIADLKDFFKSKGNKSNFDNISNDLIANEPNANEPNANEPNANEPNAPLVEHFAFMDSWDNTVDVFERAFGRDPVYTPPKLDENDINSAITSSNIEISLPAGVIGYIVTDGNSQYTTVPIDIPSTLDFGQKKDVRKIMTLLPPIPYNNLPSRNIGFLESQHISIFNNIPITQIFDFLNSLCINIQTIYTNQNSNKGLLTYLKLANSIDDVNGVLDYIKQNYDIYMNPDTINKILTYETVSSNLEKYKDSNNTTNPTLLGSILNILSTMKITYYTTYVKFMPIDIGIKNPQAIAIKKFTNNIIDNIPNIAYDINANYDYAKQIHKILSNLNSFTKFIGDLGNNEINYFPLQIYKPIAPDGYTSLGHIFCNIATDLDKIKETTNIACVPSHCVKVIREWVANDKVFEYNKNGIYWALYINPYTGTFVSTNKNAQQLPEGSVCKVVACVAKCTAVDELEKADDCTRKYYNLNKNLENESRKSSSTTLVSDQEEVFYLDKLKAQSDSIARLKSKAQQMQTSIDKATIVNREMNKNKLQNYVDTQKQNIDIIMKRLKADKNHVDTNINISKETLLKLINMIKTSSGIPKAQKNVLINKLIENQDFGLGDENLNEILNSCPQYDLSNLVKKTMVEDVCYGCDTPN
jgi:hypothetical protein